MAEGGEEAGVIITAAETSGEFSLPSEDSAHSEHQHDGLGDVDAEASKSNGDNSNDYDWENDDLDDHDGGLDNEGGDLAEMGTDHANRFANHNASSVKNKRSKKRKYKNKRHAEKQFLDSLAMHTCTISPEEASNVNLRCSVPTLVELCLRKGIHRVAISDGAQPTQIAPGIRSLLKAHQNQQNLKQVQLKWLLEALQNAEQYVKYNTLQFINKQGKKGEFFVRDCRSLYCGDDDARSEARELHKDNKSDASLVVFAGGFDYSDWAIVALAHCVNLLLPSNLSEEGPTNVKTSIVRVKQFLKKHSAALVAHCFDTALAYVWWCRGMVDKAKRAMLNVCDNIPSDNDVRLLAESKEIFRSSTLFGQQTGLYLNEIGRLLSLFDDPDVAVQFYRQAVDVINEGSSVSVDRLVLQSLALNAAAYDQGLMDQFHANKAAAFWDQVTRDPNCKEGLIQASVESFLHCHAGFSVSKTDASLTDVEKNKFWLWEANSRIEKLVRKAPQIYIHQSLVLAILGEKELAEEAYRQYMQQYVQQTDHYINQDAGPMPGSLACSGFSSFKSQPWWILTEWIATKANLAGSVISKPIRVLPLVWRRMPKHPCYMDYSEKNVFEVQGEPMNLHLTHDGFLSGALMHNLPPWKSVLLDPHTGRICIPDQYRQHELQEWRNRDCCTPCADFDMDYFIPTPILLYHDAETQTAVTIMNVSSNINFRQEVIAFNTGGGVCPRIANITSTLVYSKGMETIRVNLREVVIEARRKNILQQVKDMTPSVDKKFMKDVHGLLDFCIARSLQINFTLVKEAIDGKNEALMESVRTKMEGKVSGNSSKDSCGQKESSHKLSKQHPHQVLKQQELLYVGKSTVVLCLYTGANLPENDWDCPSHPDTLVFLDCSSPDAFRKPLIHCPDLPHLEWVLPDQKNCWKSRLFQQNVLFVYADSHRPPIQGTSRLKPTSTFVVFDEHGSIIHQENFNRGRGPYRLIPHYKACSGWSILGHDEKYGHESLKLLDAQSFKKLSEPTPEIEGFKVEQDMVFVSRSSTVIVLSPVSLEPLPVQKTSPGGTNPVARNDGVLIEGECRFLNVLAANDFSKLSRGDCNERMSYTRVILGVLNHVLILERKKSGDGASPVEVVADIVVPGVPKEAFFISHQAGFVVTASIFDDRECDPFYRENLYWFDMAGVIRGLHPMIGESPHSFAAIPLYVDGERGSKNRESGGAMEGRRRRWHLYFADGFGALCCIRLDVDDPILL